MARCRGIQSRRERPLLLSNGEKLPITARSSEADDPISQSASHCGSVICRTKVYSGTPRSIVANRGTTMADAVATHAETRALTDADLTAVSGGLFTEIGGAIVERIADA